MLNEQEKKVLKQKLRKEFLEKRQNISPKDLAAKNKALNKKLWQNKLIKEAKTIFAYLPIKNEVDLRPLLKLLLQNDQRVAVPNCINQQKGKMDACLLKKDFFTDPGKSQKDQYGILTPKEKKVIEPTEIDILLIPGLAFSKDLYRLGYGGGYYDKYLMAVKKQSLKWGIGFSEQITVSLPIEKWDYQLDEIITEKTKC